jgi:hypothetical protein
MFRFPGSTKKTAIYNRKLVSELRRIQYSGLQLVYVIGLAASSETCVHYCVTLQMRDVFVNVVITRALL